LVRLGDGQICFLVSEQLFKENVLFVYRSSS
jgi:hypothetical protein